jgi:hypothetical protein
MSGDLQQARREAAAVWREYCEQLKGAAQLFEREAIPVTELDLAEGLRYLAHLAAASVERFVDAGDPAEPRFYLLCDERIKSGGDNPDNRYYVATVSAAYQYELRGDFRACDYFSIVAIDHKDMAAGMSAAERARRGPAPRLDSATLQTEQDGSVLINAGARATAGNHLPIDRYTNLLIVRCTFERRPPQAVPLTIRRVDGKAAASAPAIATLRRQLTAAAGQVNGISGFFGDWTANFQRHVNQLPLGDQDYIRSTGGDPNILYYLSAWSLQEQQALVVHLQEIPECTTWNFQLCNVWLESLDYCTARIHTNASLARRDRDGGVTLVVSQQDPSHPNWLNTTGHRSGTMCMRFTGANSVPQPQTAVLSLAAARELRLRVAS